MLMIFKLLCVFLASQHFRLRVELTYRLRGKYKWDKKLCIHILRDDIKYICALVGIIIAPSLLGNLLFQFRLKIYFDIQLTENDLESYLFCLCCWCRFPNVQYFNELTLWGRVTHICVGNLTIIGSDNGLSPGRRQAIIWIHAGILLIGPLGTKLSEILIEIHAFSFKKMHLKTSSGKWPPSCLGLNVLTALDLLTIRDLFNLNCLKFLYKFKNKKLPLNFLDFECVARSEIHDRDTRYAHLIDWNNSDSYGGEMHTSSFSKYHQWNPQNYNGKNK